MQRSWCLGGVICAGLVMLAPVRGQADVGNAPETATTAALRREADGLREAGKLAEAADKLAEAIRQAEGENLPAAEQASLHCQRGALLQQAGRAMDARTAVERALSLGLSGQEKTAAEGLLGELKKAEAVERFRQGRGQFKARDFDEAVKTLEDAAQRAAEAGVSDEVRALIHYLRVLALREAGRDDEALDDAQKSVQLQPADADSRLELAQLLFADDRYSEAAGHADEALRLGLSDSDDQKKARKLAKDARTEVLRERLSATLSLTFGYDSNVLQGRRGETIGGRFTGGAVSTQDATLLRKLQSACGATPTEACRVQVLAQAAAATAWDLPLSLTAEVSGRLFAKEKTQLWLGYRFYQQIMMSIADDHDAYSIQEHTGLLRFNAQPARWYWLALRFEGFFNLGGLTTISPFQGGFYAGIDNTFIEHPKWRTYFSYGHQFRKSISSSDSYLDANRDDLRLTQELRLSLDKVLWRTKLGYRFRSDRSGTLETAVPSSLPTVNYFAPLGYQGHELSLRTRVGLIPWSLDFFTGVSYEYKKYADIYRFTGLAGRGAESKQRVDQSFTFDISASKQLPLGFSVDIGYTLLINNSSIQDIYDDRNYRKHTVLLTAGYSF